MLRVIHFGDLHLDAPFAAVGMAAGERLREGLRRVFGEIVARCADADLVLVSGDLFENGYVLPETLSAVREGFARLECPVVIAPGDSDPWLPGGLWTAVPWSENVHIFKKDALSSFDVAIPRTGETVTVWGWAFTSDKMHATPLGELFRPVPNRFNFLCAHADISGEKSAVCPTPLSRVLGTVVSYAALGHRMGPEEEIFDRGVTVAYCGTPEAHSFEESGGDGYWEVFFADHSHVPVLHRQHAASHAYVTLEADLGGCARDEDVVRRLVSFIGAAGLGRETSLRVRLCGEVPYDLIPNLPRVAAQTAAGLESDGKSLCSLTLEDHLLPLLASYQTPEDLDVRGEVYRALSAGLSSPDEGERDRASLAIRSVLSALDGKNIG